MGRKRINDEVGAYKFWLFDIPNVFNGQFDLPTLTPVFGFTAITAPEMTLRTEEIKPGNSHFPIKAIIGADPSPVTLSRGVVWYDSDFYRWMMYAIKGGSLPLPLVKKSVPKARRDVLLVWFHDGVKAELPFGLSSYMPIKAFLLKDAMPTRYKVGTDFDASSSERSIQELDLTCRYAEEIALTA